MVPILEGSQGVYRRLFSLNSLWYFAMYGARLTAGVLAADEVPDSEACLAP